MTRRLSLLFVASSFALTSACGGEGGADSGADAGTLADTGSADAPYTCLGSGEESPEFLEDLGCPADFEALASSPLDNTLPGARSGKVVLDRDGGDHLYFQNTVTYPIHYEFCAAHLEGVGSLSEFNSVQYFSPERRFVLGAVTHYEGPDVWALELSPYDTASAAMIESLYDAIVAHSFLGGRLRFHPTSEAVAVEAAALRADIPLVTTDELYAGIDYQPLNVGVAVGELHFATADSLADTVLSPYWMMVLDEAPNDISVVQGLVTQEFQTPLSHVNVLSRNRGTPNMGLRGAMTNATLRALEGRLVELTVTLDDWSVREVTTEEAQAFWDEHGPDPVTLPALDLTPHDIVLVEDVTREPADGETLRDTIREAVTAYGGKAAHYSVLRRTEGVPIRPALAVPVYFYDQFLRDNGFYDRVTALLADPSFVSDGAVRQSALEELVADMLTAPVGTELQDLLRTRIGEHFPDATALRFRTSTNSEDLDGFPCAGCYESHTGTLSDWQDVLDAIRQTYASAWSFRTFEERSYYGVAHDSVGMALLVHENFPDEEANGVSVTNNPFVPSGLDPAFYVNVQFGGAAEVVAPPPGVSSDQFLYYYDQPGQPITYLAHSNIIPEGSTVLTASQIHELGVALSAIREAFSPAYGPAAGVTGWYAMDIELKFDDEGSTDGLAHLFIKQARPYPAP